MIRPCCAQQFLAFLLVAFLVSLGVPTYANHLNSTTVGKDNSWPQNPELEVADPNDIGLFGDDTSNDPNGSLAQSFQIQGSTLDVRSIYIRYRNDNAVGGSGGPPSTGDLSATVTIFTVSDVTAASHAEPPPGAGSVVFTDTVIFPEALATSNLRVAHILLNSPLNLPVTGGVTGYVMHIADSPEIEWFRTGATAASVYTFGQFYEDGAWKNSGARDATLAMSSKVPEPSTILLASLLSLGVLAGRRYRQ